MRMILTLRLVLAALAFPWIAHAQPTSTGSAFGRLDAAQRRLVEAWLQVGSAPPADAARRHAYDRLDPSHRTAFETVTRALARISLSDIENGEILGGALDLLDGLQPRAEQPAPGPAGARHRLAVRLTAGAVDRLRRSSECAPEPAGPPDGAFSLVYACAGEVTVRLWILPDRTRARIDVVEARQGPRPGGFETQTRGRVAQV